MTETQVYAGIILAGCCASQVAPLIVRVHHRLEAELGDMPRWADIAAWVSAIGAAALLSVGAGAALGYESDALGHSWIIGAVWGGLGGIIGPQLWPSVRSLGIEALRRRVAAADS